MSIIIQLPLAFYLDQKRIYEIKSCSCHLDFCVYLIKRVDVIEPFTERLPEKYSDDRFSFVNHCDGCIIVCCRTFLEFVFTTEDGSLLDECSSNCFKTYPDSDFESCFELFYFGSKRDEEYFCFCCQNLSFLIQRLHTIILHKNE